MRYLRGAAAAMVVGAAIGAMPERSPAAASRGDDAKEQRLLEAVRASDAAKVAELIKAGADPNAQRSKHGTIAEAAIRYGDAGVLRAMGAGGVDFQQDFEGLNKWTPLEYSLLRADVQVETIKALLELGPKVKEIEWIWLPPCMTRAAASNPEIMRLLLKAGADANERSKDDAWSCLNFAVCSGSPGSVRALLEAGADAKKKDKHRRSVWHNLGMRYRVEGAGEIATALKESGAPDVNQPDKAGWTPLALAAYASSPDVVRALVAAGADVNKAGAGGQTPLMQAALTGDAVTIRTLLELKADPNKTDLQGTTPLYWAISAADPGARARWASHKAEPDEEHGERSEAVWDRIETSDPVGKVKALLEGGADPNRGADSFSPLALAAFIWDESMLGWSAGERSSSERSLSPNSPGAARFYREHDPMEIVKPLIAAGALRVRTGGMSDPLDLAAQRNDTHRAALMEAIAKVKTVDDDGPEPAKKPPIPPKF